MLTWEAPKEMIFEMPVRDFGLPTARDPRAPAIARPLSYLEDPYPVEGLVFGTPRCGPFATVTFETDARAVPIGS